MPEVRDVQSETIITIFSALIQIFTFYDLLDELPNILLMVMGDYAGTLDGVPYIENELLAIVKNYPAEINVEVNALGELLITGDDALQYSIDTNGNLNYTRP